MNYRFLDEARTEFDTAVDWYEAQRPGLGDDFTDEVYSTVQKIVANPHAFSRAPGAPRGREIRVLAVDRFDYLVVYEVTPGEVVILAVPHGRNNRRGWRLRQP